MRSILLRTMLACAAAAACGADYAAIKDVGVFGTPAQKQCAKILSDKCVAVVCVCTRSTPEDHPALKAIAGLKADTVYRKIVDSVRVDRNDPAEAEFINALHLDPKADVTVVLFVRPMVERSRLTADFTTGRLIGAMMPSETRGSCCGPDGCE